MIKPILISGAVLLGLASVVGWSFELPLLEQTVGGYDLLFRSAVVGGAIGLAVGVFLAIKEDNFIAKFQAFSASLLLSTLLATLVGHYTNRSLTLEDVTTEYMPVKQVTAMWDNRILSSPQPRTPPDGYYIFIETDDGTIRLLQEGSSAPEIGPSRKIAVQKQAGYWGYPRYSISLEAE